MFRFWARAEEAEPDTAAEAPSSSEEEAAAPASAPEPEEQVLPEASAPPAEEAPAAEPQPEPEPEPPREVRVSSAAFIGGCPCVTLKLLVSVRPGLGADESEMSS